MDKLSLRIEALLNEKQLFRSPDLRVQDIAIELMTNRFYVSQAINIDFGMSFTRYINMKRIDYSIKVMKAHPRMRLEEVATECGFISEKAFFRKFKEIMNDSPRAYIEKNP